MAERLIISGSFHERIAIIERDGTTIWELLQEDIGWVEVNDADVFQNGDVVFCTRMESGESGFVMRITPNYENKNGYQVVWKYTLPKGSENHGCQIIEDEKVLISKCYPDHIKIIELDRNGNICKSIGDKNKRIKYFDCQNANYDEAMNAHIHLRQPLKLVDGNYLLSAFYKEHTIIIDGDGNIISEYPYGFVFNPDIDINGNIVLGQCDKRKVVCIDRESKKILWEIAADDIDGNTLGFVAAVRALDNGNVLICNWDGHGQSVGAPIIEVNPITKELIWQLPTDDKNTISNVRVVK